LFIACAEQSGLKADIFGLGSSRNPAKMQCNLSEAAITDVQQICIRKQTTPKPGHS